MTFTEVWAMISPFINTATVIAVAGIIIKIIMTVKAESKRTALTIKQNTDILSVFKQSLPNTLSVSIEQLSKQAFSDMTTELQQQFLQPIKELKEAEIILAKAILCLKSIPDNVREELINSLKGFEKINVEENKIVLEVNKELQVYTAPKEPKIYME